MLKKSAKLLKKSANSALHVVQKKQQFQQEKSRKKVNAKLLLFYTSFSYLIVLVAVSFFIYSSYDSYKERKRLQMEAAAYEIEMNLGNTLDYAEAVLNYINRQVVSSKAGNAQISKILASFNHHNQGYNSIKNILSAGTFYWIDQNKFLVASSSGQIAKPIDLSSRDYLVNTQKDPWKIYTGTPIIGAASGQYVIPAGVGVVDAKNQYIGTAVLSFKLHDLMEKFKKIIGYYGVDFAVLNYNNQVVMESEFGLFSKDLDLIKNLKFSDESLRQELIFESELFQQQGSYFLMRSVEKYPYKILISYKNNQLTNEFLLEILPSLIELLVATIFFATILPLYFLLKKNQIS